MSRIKILASALLLGTASMSAQFTPATNTPTSIDGHPSWVVKHLDLGLSFGTTGFGLDASATLSSVVKVRAGLSYTPPVKVPLHFGLTTYDEGAIHSGNFEKAQQFMDKLSGFTVDDVVNIDGKPTMLNFKLLADIYPLRDKRWSITAGLMFGPRQAGSACNTMAEMPSLLAVGIYNKFYDYLYDETYMDQPIYGDIYLSPEMGDKLREKIVDEAGRLGIHIGDFRGTGTPYLMEPGKDGMVKAKALVNFLRPYVGLGYETGLSADNRWKMKLDCGVMMWGGAPKIVTHDGVNLTDDVINIHGKVGDYMDVVTALKVYPVVSIRFSYAIF